MSDQSLTDALNEIGQLLRRQPSMRDAVLERAQRVTRPRQNVARGYAASIIAVAACVAVVLFLLLRGDGSSRAFAQAIESVRKAHTFSCRQIFESTVDGKRQLDVTTYMFREPDLERVERSDGSAIVDVTITDYAQKRRLALRAKEKVADLQDWSVVRTVEPATGKVKPDDLYTGVRDEILRIAAESVTDKGLATLDGKDVRVLESQGKQTGATRTVYVDTKTGQPVQITIVSKAPSTSKCVYADIQLDADLAPALFSLDIPDGYKLFRGGLYKPTTEHNSEMMSKMRYLTLRCVVYANAHQDKFPDKFEDLVSPGLDEKALHTLLAAADNADGPPVILYRKPRADNKWETEIVVYEAPESRRENRVVVGMADGHAEVTTMEQFEALMK